MQEYIELRKNEIFYINDTNNRIIKSVIYKNLFFIKGINQYFFLSDKNEKINFILNNGQVIVYEYVLQHKIFCLLNFILKRNKNYLFNSEVFYIYQIFNLLKTNHSIQLFVNIFANEDCLVVVMIEEGRVFEAFVLKSCLQRYNQIAK